MPAHPLFSHEARQQSAQARRLYARFEIAHTAVDFLAALAFLVGSILFFSPSTQYSATWLFVIGSLFFAAKPTLRLTREIRLYRLGRLERLAERAEE
jgi:uncharacterized membrane protein YgdD (TMEM256/DUF423 family)